ncbi:DDE_4 domain-containing protein, partial [Cephalotus follicularis]
LHDSRHISVEEKMTMFLTIIGQNERHVVIKRRFQHSSQTIHKYLHEVLAAMTTFAREMIVPSIFDPNPDSPGAHKSLRRIFKVFYYPILYMFYIIRYLTYKIYVGSSWCTRWNTSKYYLCDVAYTNTRAFMAPYRNVKYWRAMTKEEKFNHAHAMLRNVIERAYGVLKARFSILDKMAPYPFNVQRNVVITCFAVNNFIRKEKINDELFAQYEEPQMIMEQVRQEEDVEFVTTGSHWGA